jgi:vacuolar iron transporter family protein
MRARHSEVHFGGRVGWLRAAVLGANDGVVSVASLIICVAVGGASGDGLLLTGFAGLTAGAMSMAAGEYVSVSSQSDSESADITREIKELKESPEFELNELTALYVKRGLDQPLARTVAMKLMTVDAVKAHIRDELGISEHLQARPIQAALSSAAAFSVGAAVPLVASSLATPSALLFTTAIVTLLSLLALGAASSWVGGASMIRGAARVTFWGIFAMGLSAAVGNFFGVSG